MFYFCEYIKNYVMEKKNFFLNIAGNLREFPSPCVMGIINITPDSYYSESRVCDEKSAFKRCEKLLQEGAAIIDIGAVSTIPFSDYPGEEEEIKRLMSVFPALRKEFPDAVFSIDTYKANVARIILDEGADIINDISGGELDEKMFPLIAEKKAPYIIMHMRGTPKNMQDLTDYGDLLKEVNNYFSQKISTLTQMGVSDIIVDPGFGFSKTVEQNYQLLKHAETFCFHGLPVLIAISRKSMIYKVLDSKPEDVLPGTMALQTIALLKGASILRVHDVGAAMQAVKLVNYLQEV